MAIKEPTAQLLGTFLEILGFGIYLVVGPQAFLVIRQKRLRRGLTIYLYSTMITTFVLIISHVIIDLIEVFLAFTTHTNVPNAPEAYFAGANTKLIFTKISIAVITTLVADILLIYRTWVLWDRRRWALILPVILYCFDVAMSIWFAWCTMGVPTNNHHTVLDNTAYARSRYFFGATLAVNLVCTCLIAYRIRMFQIAMVGCTSTHHRMGNVLSIVLESAVIYTASLVCMIILACIHSYAMFVVFNAMPPLIGLVFTWVVLRSSAEDDHQNGDEESPKWRSEKMSLTIPTTERIVLEPTNRPSSLTEEIRIQFN